MHLRELIELLQEIEAEHGGTMPVRVEGDPLDDITDVLYSAFHNKVYIEAGSE